MLVYWGPVDMFYVIMSGIMLVSSLYNYGYFIVYKGMKLIQLPVNSVLLRYMDVKVHVIHSQEI